VRAHVTIEAEQSWRELLLNLRASSRMLKKAP
jgi:hypothetical protein